MREFTQSYDFLTCNWLSEILELQNYPVTISILYMRLPLLFVTKFILMQMILFR